MAHVSFPDKFEPSARSQTREMWWLARISRIPNTYILLLKVLPSPPRTRTTFTVLGPDGFAACTGINSCSLQIVNYHYLSLQCQSEMSSLRLLDHSPLQRPPPPPRPAQEAGLPLGGSVGGVLEDVASRISLSIFLSVYLYTSPKEK